MAHVLLRYRWLAEPAIALVFFILWAIAEVGGHQLVPGTRSGTLPFWVALLGLSVSIGLSRVRPVVSMAVGTAVLLGQLLFPAGIFDNPAIYAGYGIVVAVVSATVRGRLRVAALVFALGAGISSAGLLCWWVGLDSRDPVNRAWIFAFFAVIAALLWLGGTLVGVAGQRAASERRLAETSGRLLDAETDATVAAERERIAQDVHDIMAHSLSVILAQADGARMLSEERPTAVAPALGTIAATARSSLSEVRMLIESLVGAPDGPTHPGIDDLDELMRRMSDSGLDVTVERFGDATGLTPVQELAVYRIVQESLTNALKHAGPEAVARVALDGRDDGLAISVASRPKDSGPAAAHVGANGRGLIGMRERARLAGGWLDAGADDDVPGGYLVTGYIPGVGGTGPTA